MSRPIINLFVARGIEGTEGLAVLTIVYALAHLPYGWLNELKNLPPAFQKLDPDTRFIRRFTVACGFLAFIFIEKIDFPSPQKEIIEDVSDKIIKIK